MIEVITGAIGFIAGISMAVIYFKRQKREHWGKGYINVRNDIPQRTQQYNYPQQTQTNSSDSNQNQGDDPKLPNWF